MNWQAVTFDWNQARAFLATVEAGSLSAAARHLRQTQPTIGRQIAALEAHLGVVLFERVGKSLTLTPTGREVLPHVRAMFEAATRLSITATGHTQDMTGTVRITVSDIFAQHLMPRIVTKIQEAAPGLTIDILAQNAISDLQHREADIAIRHVRPTEPELTARLLCDTTARFYAAHSYVAANSLPRTPQDAPRHSFVGFGNTAEMLGYMKGLGLEIREEQFRVGSANGIVAWELVRQGHGLAPMSDLVAAPDPLVRPVFETLEAITFPIWLTTHREIHTSRRIRLVYDLLAEHLSKLTP